MLETVHQSRIVPLNAITIIIILSDSTKLMKVQNNSVSRQGSQKSDDNTVVFKPANLTGKKKITSNQFYQNTQSCIRQMLHTNKLAANGERPQT